MYQNGACSVALNKNKFKTIPIINDRNTNMYVTTFKILLVIILWINNNNMSIIIINNNNNNIIN